MDLVTVTCLQDKEQFLLQAESIQKFLKPCRHWVIVNDEIVDEEEWKKSIEPFYDKHELKLLFFNWNTFPRGSGYQKHQCYKLLISKVIKSDYLVLDSKNFFIKDSDTEDWRGIIGSGRLQDYSTPGNIWLSTIETYQKRLSVIANPKKQISIETPFVIKKEILDNILNFDKFLFWFNRQQIDHSEFLYYSLIAETKGLLHPDLFFKKPLHQTFFPGSPTNLNEQLARIDNSAEIKVFGLHRNYINKLDQNNLNILRSWLSNKGLYKHNFLML